MIHLLLGLLLTGTAHAKMSADEFLNYLKDLQQTIESDYKEGDLSYVRRFSEDYKLKCHFAVEKCHDLPSNHCANIIGLNGEIIDRLIIPRLGDVNLSSGTSSGYPGDLKFIDNEYVLTQKFKETALLNTFVSKKHKVYSVSFKKRVSSKSYTECLFGAGRMPR